jgi:hypothetical protein
MTLQKDLIPCRGLLLLAIKEKFPRIPPFFEFEDLKEILEVHLSAKLDSLTIKDVPIIIRNLIQVLIDHQALLTMSAF